jgi:2'-5' RNA ligase
MSSYQDKNKDTYLPLIDLSFITSDIKKLADSIDKDDLLNDEIVTKHPIESDHHITLHFGLPFDDKMYKKVASETSQFILTIRDFGSFTNKDKKFDDGTTHSYDILWVDVKDPGSDLSSLHEKLVEESGIKPRNAFKPHVTVAYLKYGKAQKYIDEWNVQDRYWSNVITEYQVKKYREKTQSTVYKFGH